MTAIARRVAIMQWSPRRFGAGLYAAWDPEQRASLDLSGGAVSTWRDYVNGYAPTQGIGASRAAYATSALNGRAVVRPDGIDDQSTLVGVPTGFPTGATPYEIWVVWNQVSLVADTTLRSTIFWGDQNFFTGIVRDVIGGVNRARLYVSASGSVIQPTNLNVDLSGRRVLRAVVDGVNARVDVDGVAGAALAVVPAIATTRIRLFANVANTAGAFGAGDYHGIFVTRLLAADEASKMYAYCNQRIV